MGIFYDLKVTEFVRGLDHVENLGARIGYCEGRGWLDDKSCIVQSDSLNYASLRKRTWYDHLLSRFARLFCLGSTWTETSPLWRILDLLVDLYNEY